VGTATTAVATGRAWLGPAGVTLAGVAASAYVALNDPFTKQLWAPCPLLEYTGLACPSCGGTRAAHLLTRGDVIGALDYNAVFVLALPVILLAFYRWWAGSLGLRVRTGWSTTTARTVVGVVLLWGVLRNLPFGPLAWLAP
jgi:hypothetical protein